MNKIFARAWRAFNLVLVECSEREDKKERQRRARKRRRKERQIAKSREEQVAEGQEIRLRMLGGGGQPTIRRRAFHRHR